MPTKNITAILILGMHRSGTSATAGTLYHLGVSLGPRLLPADGCNERGYFENHNILQLNHDLMSALGFSWDDPRELPHGWESSAVVIPFRSKLREIIETDFSEQPLWGVKDPRICRLLPFWLPVLRESGSRVVALLALRHPLEVAKSLTARSPEMEAEHAELIWLRHNLEAELHSRGLPRASIDYASLLTNWRTEIIRIGERLGIAWPRSLDDAGARIGEFLGEDLHHQSATDQLRGASKKFQPWLIPLYHYLHDSDKPLVESNIDEISRRLARPARISASRCLARRHGLLHRAVRKLHGSISQGAGSSTDGRQKA